MLFCGLLSSPSFLLSPPFFLHCSVPALESWNGLLPLLWIGKHPAIFTRLVIERPYLLTVVTGLEGREARRLDVVATRDYPVSIPYFFFLFIFLFGIIPVFISEQTPRKIRKGGPLHSR